MWGVRVGDSTGTYTQRQTDTRPIVNMIMATHSLCVSCDVAGLEVKHWSNSPQYFRMRGGVGDWGVG